ncbi:MAG: S-adenosylmethionine:tRNA ribosyltransferase-isomerase [Bacteroidales bacterium]|nr:S-adenosylmethionine:tRNA ribosyltransferase-isomerase [Bacteroidales bacterium]
MPIIKMEDYHYHLPEEKIAFFPTSERASSKLLVYKNGQISDHYFSEISEILPTNSFLIFNNTKVIPARLVFHKESGTRIEIFCLEPLDDKGEHQKAMSRQKSAHWKCIVGNLKRWKTPVKMTISAEKENIILSAFLESREDEKVNVRFEWTPENYDFSTVLHYAGKIPLPPYIKRDNIESDTERYQTVYAQNKGSVAAPTAGLHYTPEVLQSLREKNILQDFITLHVGAGTFKPVTSETANEHLMHSEPFIIRKALIENILNNKSRSIFAVGTTSTRSLESIYWLALKNFKNKTSNDFTLAQWDAYSLKSNDFSLENALDFWLENNFLKTDENILANTSMMMIPGYKHRVVNNLITNFHQPGSTLLLLLASFIGDHWKNLYKHALNNDYRFLSYGDSSIIMP